MQIVLAVPPPTTNMGGETTSASSGLEEPTDEEAFQEVVEKAQQEGPEKSKNDVKVSSGTKPNRRATIDTEIRSSAEQVRIDDSHEETAKIKSPVYIIEDLTLMRSEIAAKFPFRDDWKAVSRLDVKFFVSDNDGTKLVLNNLAELYKWNKMLTLTACEDHLISSISTFLKAKKTSDEKRKED